MSVTARALITGAYRIQGVYELGETPPAANLQDAFERLNRMMGSWAIQPLTIPSVAREVFPMTADVGTYTIGPGGDFDTSKPARLTGAALLLNSSSTTVSVTSITRSGFVATVTAASHGAATGQNVTIAGASPAAYNGTWPITVLTVNTFTYTFQGAESSASGTITALVESDGTDVVELPLPVITDDAWQAIQIKTLTSSLCTDVYYNPTFFGGLGTINLWPIPTSSDNSLVLYRSQQLSKFTSLTAQYDLPDGYEDAIIYQLWLRLASPNGMAVDPDVRQLATEAMAWVKRQNTKLSDLPIDPAFTTNRRGGYNIITGNG